MNVFLLFFLISGMCLQAQTKIIAHRGHWTVEGSAQNSIAALKRAGSLPIYGTEFDVHLTKDQVLILNHDPVFHGKAISDHSYSALRRSGRLSNGEALPRLARFFRVARRYPNLKLIVELKPGPNQLQEKLLVEKTLELVKRKRLESRVEYISFSANICRELKQQNPASSVQYLRGDLSPIEVQQNGWNGIDYHFSLYQKNEKWSAQARSIGLTTNAWTVNDPRIFNQLVELGVEYITTDYPHKFTK